MSEMPQIEPGDWMSLRTDYRTDVIHVPSGLNRVGSDIEADAFNQRGRWHTALPNQLRPDVLEIRGERNGVPFIWRREAQS